CPTSRRRPRRSPPRPRHRLCACVRHGLASRRHLTPLRGLVATSALTSAACAIPPPPHRFRTRATAAPPAATTCALP
ncbi:unnamed protein product, partial [Closterium sp. NIES-53]